MSKIKIILFSIFLFVAIACSGSLSPQTSLSGQLKNLPKGLIKLNLEEDINRKISRTVAEIAVGEDGSFRFDGDLVPHIYTLKISDKKTVTLAIGAGQKVVISGDVNNADSIVVTGSEDTVKFESYEKFRKESLNRLVISIRNQIKSLNDKKTPENESKILELTKLEVANYDKHKDELIEFIKNEMGTSIAVYATSIRWDGEKNLPFLNELVKQFEAAHPNLDVTKKISEKVKILNANSIGGKVAEIKMPDKNGDMIALSSVKAKYILIDFWGSWCAPCRRESGELGELYQKFKSQGFEIYGVGLESEKELWLKAIEQDKRIWTNVSTFQEFETPVTFDYAVTSLPANFLIDENGKVIAKNLHGKELREMVESLFLGK
jgi:thiol-disulfide isomerase/thioredoxin